MHNICLIRNANVMYLTVNNSVLLNQLLVCRLPAGPPYVAFVNQNDNLLFLLMHNFKIEFNFTKHFLKSNFVVHKPNILTSFTQTLCQISSECTFYEVSGSTPVPRAKQNKYFFKL